MTPIHDSTSVEDAMHQLDTRIPLLHREKLLIVRSLYDLGFREGARQGRQAGIEHVQQRLRDISVETPSHQLRALLLDVAGSFDDPRSEYRDPTTAIRERLANRKAG